MSYKILVTVIFTLLMALIGCSELSESSNTTTSISGAVSSAESILASADTINSVVSERQSNLTTQTSPDGKTENSIFEERLFGNTISASQNETVPTSTASQTSPMNIEENDILENLESEMSSVEECSENNSEVENSDSYVKSTDIILGEILMSADGKLQSLKRLTITAYPGNLEPIGFDDLYYVRHSGLFIGFRDFLGKVVYCSEFIAYSDGALHPRVEFIVRIPRLPEFESVVIFDSSIVLGSIARSKNAPTVKIISPITESVFCYGDVMRMSERIQVVWDSTDKDGDTLDYSIWYSIDGGITYELTSLEGPGILYASDLFEATRVLLRIYVTDGTNTAFDEISFKLSTDLKNCLDFPNFDESVENALADCQSRMLTKSNQQAFPGTADVIIGKVWKSDEGIPLAWSLEKIDSREILYEPREHDENPPMFMVELHNKMGETVYCSSFEVNEPHGDFPFTIPGKIAQKKHRVPLYKITVPNPPEYETIKIFGAGGELWSFSRSRNLHADSITNPSEGDKNDQNRCELSGFDLPDVAEANHATDVLWGSVYRSRDGEPLSVEVTGFETRPGLLPIEEVDRGSLVLFAELLDSSGETLHRYPFTIGGEPFVDSFFSKVLPGTVFSNRQREALFQVFMPNPPEYDKMAITYSGKELRMIERSPNAPVVNILTPECGSKYISDEEITVSWAGGDADRDDITYDTYYSIDGGLTFKFGDLRYRDIAGAKQVHVRVYASDGTRTSFDDTCFVLEAEMDNIERCFGDRLAAKDIEGVASNTPAEETEEQASTDPENIQPPEQKECQLDTTDIPEAKTSTESTDFIWGTMHVTDDGEPLRLESIEVRTYPGSWQPVEPDDGDHIFDIELRDALGESAYSAPIMVFGDWNAEFLVRIPDPPEYESIAILDSGRKIGEIWKSPNSPEIEIRRPEHGSVFCYEDVLRMLDYVRLSWSGDDRDGDELEYDIWISTDGGETYELTNTLRSNFHPSDLYGAEEVYARVYVTDGRNTAFDETYFVLDHGE